MSSDVGRWRVTRAWTATNAEPISTVPGDRLTVEYRETEWPGWIWCENRRTGKSGWVPESWVAAGDGEGLALRRYSAVELTVEVGDLLEGRIIESGWAWATDVRGRSGWVPLERLEKV